MRGDRYVLVAHAAHLPDRRAARRARRGDRVGAVRRARGARRRGARRSLRADRARAASRSTSKPPATTLADALAIADGRGARAAARRARAGLRPAARAACRLRRARDDRVLGRRRCPRSSRMTLDALVAARRAATTSSSRSAPPARTPTQRILAAYPQVRIEADAADPLLTDAREPRDRRSADRELVVLVADDVLLASRRARPAARRVRAHPGARRRVSRRPGAPGGEGVVDVDVRRPRAVARARRTARGAARARELEPIDLAVTPAGRVSRAALEAVGGIDPALRADAARDRRPRAAPARRRIRRRALRRRARAPLRRRTSRAIRPPPPARSSRSAPLDAGAIARGFDPAAARRRSRARRCGACRGTRSASTTPSRFRSPTRPSSSARPRFLPRPRARSTRGAGPGARAARRRASRRPTPSRGSGRCSPRSGQPMDATVAVRVERVADLAAWRAALDRGRARRRRGRPRARRARRRPRTVAAASLRELLEPAPMRTHRTHEILAPWSTGTPVLDAGAARRRARSSRCCASAGRRSRSISTSPATTARP